MTNKHLCIHGHFYQPPRENPWLNAIEYQASAAPYHDWNERITRECYGPNARARLYGGDGQILKLINNYEHMSFDFGPTLLSWMEKAHPWVYAQILAGDHASRTRYKGHGNALAQVYNHIIMPLATCRDKRTQIRWGLADFKHRFGRQAEGMWLAETAVDIETLDLMAREGVKFTILAPSQAKSIRPLTGADRSKSWQDVSGGRIDPTRPYRVRLGKTGRRFIDVFFYNESPSKAVAFEKLLASGENFLARIEQAFGPYHDGARLVSLATDGESYGHHFKFGDLALSWLFHHLEQTGQIKTTNYGLFLEQFPPEEEVEIFENSSWSCAHGVERWRSDCGCCIAHVEGWNQKWRAPLRQGLDWLAQEIAVIFERQVQQIFKNPWKTRDDYITVILEPSPKRRDRFLKYHALGPLSKEKEIKAFQLLESQRMSLYMFTSCGWFFDDISGLEAVQVLKYAARAIDLIRPWAEKDLEAGLIDFLSSAKSNDPEYGDGKKVYKDMVKLSRIGPSHAVAHFVLACPMEGPPWEDLFSRIVHPIRRIHLQGQNLDVILGEAQVKEGLPPRKFNRIYLAFRRQWPGLTCLVGECPAEFDLAQAAEKIRPAVMEASLDKTEAVFRRHLTAVKRYQLTDLIVDTRKGLVDDLAAAIARNIKGSIRKDSEFKELMLLIQQTGESVPEILRGIFRLTVTDELSRLIDLDKEKDFVDWEGLRHLTDKAGYSASYREALSLRQNVQDFLRRRMNLLASNPDHILIKNIISFLDLVEKLKLDPDLWESRNIFFDLYNTEFIHAAGPDLSPAFHALGKRLGFQLEEIKC